MTTYERIEDLRAEMQAVREDYPLKSGLVDVIEKRLEKAILEVPTDRTVVWDGILKYLWDRMAKDIYDLEKI
jgi:hypothetical protein